MFFINYKLRVNTKCLKILLIFYFSFGNKILMIINLIDRFLINTSMLLLVYCILQIISYKMSFSRNDDSAETLAVTRFVLALV